MDKITIVSDDEGEEESTFSKKYNRKMLDKINEIVDWINSQG